MRAGILGLDTSTTCVGWAVLSLDYASDKELVYGKIIPPTEASWFGRTDYILQELGVVCGAHPIVAAGVEELNYARSMSVVRAIAGMNMLCQYQVYKSLKIEPISMNTTNVKKVFSGYGAAKKWDMIAAANRIYGLSLVWPQRPTDQKNKELTDDDIADAIGVAHVLMAEIGDDLRASLGTF